MRKRFLLFFVVVFLAVILLIVHWQSRSVSSPTSQQPDETELSGRQLKEHYLRNVPRTITIGAVGDILIHDRVYRDAETKDGYDFTPMLEDVKPLLSQPDIVIANQESILGGTELGLSSYPSFNSPQEVGDALIESGIDIVSTANNHTLDRGEEAILRAIAYYERNGLPYVGHFKDREDQKRIRIIEKKGIRVAFLAYTYGTNGIPVPEGKDYLVNLIELDAIREEVERAQSIADCIVLSIHWGKEYERYPNEHQKELAREFASMGVDIIFGHHPHVLQPLEWIETEAGTTFVAYSLGNFLAGQSYPDPGKDFGGLVTIDVVKGNADHGSTIQLKKPQFYPTYIYSENEQNYRVIPLKNTDSLPDAEKKYEEIMAHVMQWIE